MQLHTYFQRAGDALHNTTAAARSLLTVASSEECQLSVTELLRVWLRRDIFRGVKRAKKKKKHLLTASNLCAAVLISPSFRKWEKITICASLIFGCGCSFFSAREPVLVHEGCAPPPLQVAQLYGKH